MNIIRNTKQIQDIIERDGSISLLFYKHRCIFSRQIDIADLKNMNIYFVSPQFIDDLAVQLYVDKTPTLVRLYPDFERAFYLIGTKAIRNYTMELNVEKKYTDSSTQTRTFLTQSNDDESTDDESEESSI